MSGRSDGHRRRGRRSNGRGYWRSGFGLRRRRSGVLCDDRQCGPRCDWGRLRKACLRYTRIRCRRRLIGRNRGLPHPPCQGRRGHRTALRCRSSLGAARARSALALLIGEDLTELGFRCRAGRRLADRRRYGLRCGRGCQLCGRRHEAPHGIGCVAHGVLRTLASRRDSALYADREDRVVGRNEEDPGRNQDDSSEGYAAKQCATTALARGRSLGFRELGKSIGGELRLLPRQSHLGTPRRQRRNDCVVGDVGVHGALPVRGGQDGVARRERRRAFSGPSSGP